jgi:hypothetical protein
MDFSIFLPAQQKNDDPCLFDLQRLIGCYRQVTDRHDARGVRYPLWLLLIVATLAKWAGINEVQALADWAYQRKGKLCRLFGFWQGERPVGCNLDT